MSEQIENQAWETNRRKMNESEKQVNLAERESNQRINNGPSFPIAQEFETERILSGTVHKR